MKIFLDSIGCRLNQSEIEQYASQFRAAGHEIVSSAAEADCVVVNTCAVTSEAASDSRGKIRQAGRATRGDIIVTGCWSTLEPRGAESLPGVRKVIPNLQKDHLVTQVLASSAAPEPGGTPVFDLEPVAREPLPGTHLRTRAFIKAQDGCDNHCTFCITRVARGPGRSRPVDEVLADARMALEGGAREIVLTGVHLGSWGQDFNAPRSIRDLVERLLALDDLPRLRLSSLEPWDLDGAFFSLWSDPRLCRHLHLPLQSGCAATLKRMARKTTPETFARLVEAARAASPRIAITTDIIVGFPGETDEEFAASLEFARAMHFAGGHVFSYSAREGTPAARLPGAVAAPVRKHRSALMRAAFAASAEQYSRQFVGEVASVLWESTDSFGPGGWRLHGLTDNYLHVSAVSPERLWNVFSPVKLIQVVEGGLAGEIAA